MQMYSSTYVSIMLCLYIYIYICMSDDTCMYANLLFKYRHPDADTLYVEKIDLGEAEPRTIVSGNCDVAYVRMYAGMDGCLL